ncbi:uncharacterized protein LOC132639819 [Lycium barbarum]|uniref:uncharacterized protein LOC132639819 n=1 Tax=Lycium barbarum TaxID=112863 RepID=UPI00293F6104|nr:uncharacterized protein LOC132639819 [Lycium barbarum]
MTTLPIGAENETIAAQAARNLTFIGGSITVEEAPRHNNRAPKKGKQLSYFPPATDNLGRIASYLGKPFCTDRLTAEEGRLSYARILVEVDVTQPLPEQLTIEEAKGKTRVQEVSYDWYPEYYKDCMCLGHVVEACPVNLAAGKNAKNKGVTAEKVVDPKPTAAPTYPQGRYTQAQHGRWQAKPGNQITQVQGEVTNQTGSNDHGGETQELNQGLNQPFKQKELRSFLLKHRIDLLGCLETKIKQRKVEKFRRFFGENWTWYVDYSLEPNGRIWLGWKHSNVKVTVVLARAQLIHCYVEDKGSSFATYVTFVYGYNTNTERKEIWNTLRHINHIIAEPWLLLGDFNTCLSVEDRINGTPVHHQEIQDFIGCVENIGLGQMTRRGCEFIWCNKRMLWHANLEALIGLPECLDHSLILVNTSVAHQPSTNPFRLLNVLLKQEEFKAQVEQIWEVQVQGFYMYKVWRKLQLLGAQCKQLNRTMNSLETKLYSLKGELQEVQEKLSQNMLMPTL